jgi:hypothetical protein
MKNIVICSDGTGNEYGENNTNVVETYAICEKAPSQVVFYDPGVGTGGWECLEGRKPGKPATVGFSLPPGSFIFNGLEVFSRKVERFSWQGVSAPP